MKYRYVWVCALFILIACSTGIEQRATSPEDGEQTMFQRTTGPKGPEILIGLEAADRERKLSSFAPIPGGKAGLLTVVDTPYQIFEGQGTYVHVAAWRLNGEPAPLASVFVGDEEVGRTSEEGSLVFLYRPSRAPDASETEDGFFEGQRIVVVDADDHGLRGEVEFTPQTRTASFATDHIYVYTDRGTYPPGDTIHIRAIGWHLQDDYKPLVSEEVAFILKDQAGYVVTGGKARTDSFGVVALDLPLPGSASQGIYTLEVAYQQARESTRLEVRRFQTPMLEIGHDLPRFLTSHQTSLTTAFTLKPTIGGDVQDAEIVLVARSGTRNVRRVMKVKGHGPHTITLTKRELDTLRRGIQEGELVMIEVSVSDARSRQATIQRELRFTRNQYVAILETERGEYAAGEPVGVVVKIGDLEGAPAAGKALRVQMEGEPFEATTDAMGVATLTLTMPDMDTSLSLYVDGVKDPLYETDLAIVSPQPMRSRVAEPTIKEGDTAEVIVHFPAGIRPINKVVHMDVVDTSGAIVNALLLPIEEVDGKPVARGKFTAPSWGSMLLTFFTLGVDESGGDESEEEATGEEATEEETDHVMIGLITEGQNLVVHPNKVLTITLENFSPIARPGDNLRLNARVTNPMGEPVEASIGAAIVDGRIISLRDPLEISPMVKLYDPKLRTMATTGAQILTWPVVSRNWGGHIHDIALPPFNFQQGGQLELVYSALADDDEAAIGGRGALGMSGAGKEVGGYALGSAGSAGPPPTIRIRTNFPATSFWNPHIHADTQGLGRIEALLPDTVTEQELILVASDRNGGIGLLRERIAVTREIYAFADFPGYLTAGEQVGVPVFLENVNLPEGFDGELVMEILEGAQDLEIETPRQKVEVGVGVSTARVFQIKALNPGTVRVRVSARATSGSLLDALEQALVILPAGAPNVRTSTGQATKTAPFEASWMIDGSSLANQSFISVSFPAVTTASLGLDALEKSISTHAVSRASDLVSAALFLQYAEANNLRSASVDELRTRVFSGVASLTRIQNHDGSFSFWPNGRPSPYITAWALEGLIEASRAGVALEGDAIERAALWLGSQIQDDFSVAMDDIGFWQGDAQAQRLGVAAGIFDVLTRTPKELRAPQVDETIRRMQSHFNLYLTESPTLDPLAAGLALSALVRTGAMSPATAGPILNRVIALRQRGHWEPSWFHAYGGRIEATVAVLAALDTLDEEGKNFQAERRDAIGYILSTRDAFGHWHNERGTAQAIRAILIAARNAPKEGPATVEIRRGNRVIYSGEVDPADPFGSTLFLNHVTIGENLPAGRHQLSVSYTGNLRPHVTLTHRTWGPSAASTADHRLQSLAQARVGQSPNLEFHYAGDPHRRLATLAIPSSGLLDIDTDALEELIAAAGPVTSYRHRDGELLLTLSLPVAPTTIALPFIAVRPGKGRLPSAVLTIDGRRELLQGPDIAVTR